MREISKEEFKKSIIENVKNQYRRTIDEATPQQIFQAVSYAIKDVIIDDWIATQKQFDETGAKKVYYLSMEFLMGRALGNNIINLGAKKSSEGSTGRAGFDLNAIEDQEPDPALWKRRSGASGSMFSGFPGNSWLSGLRLRHPLPLRYVQAENSKTATRWRCRMSG